MAAVIADALCMYLWSAAAATSFLRLHRVTEVLTELGWYGAIWWAELAGRSSNMEEYWNMEYCSFAYTALPILKWYKAGLGIGKVPLFKNHHACPEVPLDFPPCSLWFPFNFWHIFPPQPGCGSGFLTCVPHIKSHHQIFLPPPSRNIPRFRPSTLIKSWLHPLPPGGL